MIASALVCVVAAPLLPAPLILAWLAVLSASSWLEEHLYQRALSAGPAPLAALILPAIFKTLSTALYATMAAALIVKGQAAAREFAFATLAVSMVYVLMRYYRSPWIFLLCISPHVAVLTWVGFDLTRDALGRGEWVAACTPAATVALFAVLFWAARLQLEESWTALAAATTQARERERAADAANHAKSSFLACMSHELRTPLNGVLGMAQVMAASDLSAPQRERLKTIRRSGQTLLSVLDDLLDLSRIEADDLQPMLSDFDLPHLVRGVCTTFDHLAQKKGLALQIAIAADVEGLCIGDSARLRRALSALLSNAVKFTDDGGVDIRVERQGEEVLFRITDTGVGISADQMPNLFAAFSQADGSLTRRFGGTGIGLAICERLARLMGGSLTAASELGRGSTFTLQLPLPSRSCAAVSPASAAPLAAERDVDGPLRVLAAEDNPVNQLVLQSLLAQVGIEATVVQNGRQAVDAWCGGAWDLVIMDVQMPEMDGVSATRAIREQERVTGRSRTPIIALTSNTMTHQLAEYAAAGMDDVVPKPVDATRLFGAIEHTLNVVDPAGAHL